MLTIQAGGSAQAVLQGAQHVLFVEGKKDGLDVTVLGELFTPKLRVEPLGPCFSVRSVAAALHEFHPKYWFVIDRDDWSDVVVEQSWANFPDPVHDNLLIWRRKELESYFLEPAWVCQSQYVGKRTSEDKVRAWIEENSSAVVYLNAANRVLVFHRNLIKHCQGELLSDCDVKGCSQAQVADKLVKSDLLMRLSSAVATDLTEQKIRDAFDRECELLTGGQVPLRWGTGRWRELIGAKAIFRTMVNRWFRVPDLAKGGSAHLTGRDAERALVVDLLKNHQEMMPSDLADLKVILDQLT